MKATGFSAFTGLLLAFAALGATPSQQDKLDWIRAHAEPVRSVDIADEDFSDLMPLAAAIGDARIVQLGEATHGDGTAFLAKSRIVRFLHEYMGFDVLLWESAMLGCRMMDAGLRDADKSAYEAAQNNIFAIWSQSAQVQELLEYLKRTQATVRPMRTAGVDCRLGYAEHKEKWAPEFLLGFFDRIDPQLLTQQQREEIFRICRTVEYSDYYYNPGPRDLDMSVMHMLVEYLDTHGDAVSARSSAAEADFVRQLLVSEIGYERFCDETGRKVEQKTINRDMIMGQNLVWQATGPFRNHKIIVWAHNFHIMESQYMRGTAEAFDRFDAEHPEAGPMGHVASYALGEQLYTIGFSGYAGSYGYANDQEAPNPIAPAANDTLEWYLNQVDSPHAFLDFQSLPAGHWLRQPLKARFYFWKENTSLWPRVYDAVFFSKTIEPSVNWQRNGQAVKSPDPR